MATQEENRAQEQARTQLGSIIEMVEALGAADVEAREEALQTIQEDPLEVSVRNDWHNPGEESKDTEYKILLCTGGPAVRIIGDLNEYGEPETAQLQYQDWFTSWGIFRTTDRENEALLAYARCFYFGPA